MQNSESQHGDGEVIERQAAGLKQHLRRGLVERLLASLGQVAPQVPLGGTATVESVNKLPHQVNRHDGQLFQQVGPYFLASAGAGPNFSHMTTGERQRDVGAAGNGTAVLGGWRARAGYRPALS